LIICPINTMSYQYHDILFDVEASSQTLKESGREKSARHIVCPCGYLHSKWLHGCFADR